MTHKCEYCATSIKPCAAPCLDKKDKDHVCCTCNIDEAKCELPERIVCANSLCNLKYSLDYYKNRLEELKGEAKLNENKLADLIALVNEWRLLNVGSPSSNIVDIIAKGALSIGNVKLYVTQQRLTWDRFPVEVGYIIMCLHEEFLKQWGEWLNQKAVKQGIKKDITDKTNKDLKTSEAIRNGLAKADGSLKSEKQVKTTLTKTEKIILDRIKTFGWTQNQAEESLTAMGMVLEPKPRNLKELGLV